MSRKYEGTYLPHHFMEPELPYTKTKPRHEKRKPETKTLHEQAHSSSNKILPNKIQ